MKIRAVCFDFGGTLDAPGLHWLERFAALYGAAGCAFSWDEIRAAFDHATRLAYADHSVAGFGMQPLIEFHVDRQLEYLQVNDRHIAARLVNDFVGTSRT
ncbi:MAG: hypothetical protein HY270_17165, partial [Deltaproteobacteria bacterium]|nr:hypothetical protein [Deltaproteobacteria bacterium]